MTTVATVDLEHYYTSDDRFENNIPTWFQSVWTIVRFVAYLVTIIWNVGFIVAGVWLLVLGEWKAAGLGLLGQFCVGTFLLGWIDMLLLPFFPLMSAAQKKRSLGLMVAVVVGSNWLRYFVISLWMVGSFRTFLNMTKPEALIPACIVGLIVAIAPWISMGAQEQDNEHAILSWTGITTMGIILAIGFGAFHWDGHTAFWLSVGFFNAFTFLNIKVMTLTTSDFPRLKQLKWYESLWSYFPAIFVLFGGYLWGALGIATAYGNRRIFNSKIHTALKFLSTGAISGCLCFVYLAVCSWFVSGG